MTPRRRAKSRDERRRNPVLRELMDELLDHVRTVTQDALVMPREDLEYARDRLEWLADEIWRNVMEHPPDDG